MGFFLQLRILLWKNFTLKKRNPPRLMLELFIPLVLFVILLCIRKKQPAKPEHARKFVAQPLPSAGVISIMQAFCDHGKKDNEGFQSYPNAETYQFLSQFNDVASHNNFFDPGFQPEDMDKLPGLYRTIIDDPAALHDKFKQAKDFSVGSMFPQNRSLQDVMNQVNVTLPAEDVQAMSRSTVNVKEVYRLLFGTDLDEHVDAMHKVRKKREASGSPLLFDPSLLSGKSLFSPTHFPKLKDLFGDTAVHVSYLDRGLIMRSFKENPQLLADPEVRRVLGQLMGLSTGGDDSEINPLEVADVMKKILLEPSTLQYMTCHDDELNRILIPSTPEDGAKVHDSQMVLCNMSDSQWQQMSVGLNSAISSQDIVNKLDLNHMNLTATEVNLQDFSVKLQEFILFERNLMELSSLASKLPSDACKHPEVSNVTMGPNVTSEENSTTTTETPRAHHHHEEKKKKSHDPLVNEYEGLLKVWLAMQKTVCGREPVSKEKIQKFEETNKFEEEEEPPAPVPSRSQHEHMLILMRVLYGNPRVLYAPNNSQVDVIMKKANATFAMVDRINEYAEKWLNVSAEIRQYLQKNTTEHNLKSIREMQRELKEMPGVVQMAGGDVDPDITYFVNNMTVPDVDFFLHQLEIVDNAACSWLSMLKGISLNVFMGFQTEEEIIDYALNKAYFDNVTVLAGVIVTNVRKDGTLPPHVEYKIRQNATFTQTTKKIRPSYWFPGPAKKGYNYYQYGFVWIQDVIERSIIDLFTGREVVEPGSYLHEIPYPCYMKDEFLFMIEHVMPLCLTISWVYTVAMLTQSIVYEKEQRLKEVMKMMGLNNSVHWLAWFLTTFTQMSVTMAILTMMLKFGNVLMYSNGFIVFLTLEIFAGATIAFSFLISVMYSKAKLAAACAGIVYFLSYVPYMYVAIREEAAGDEIPAWTKSIASLFSTTAFGLGAKYFAFYEIEGVGVQWNNIYITPVEHDEYNLFMVLLMMVLDTMMYFVFTWYIENVHPGSYGLPKPWYFPFTKSYWFGGHAHIRAGDHTDHCCGLTGCCRRRAGGLSVTEDDQACAMGPHEDAHHNLEPEPTHLPMGVCIDNLTKVYKTGKLAVNKLSLNLFEGQITSFLGHNGAGKTTTMSILTGLFPPTSGFATIYGHDIRTEMEEIRKSLGMCPQHNVLFDRLTVEEHLWFYSRLKGMEQQDIKEETESMIADIGLPGKRNCVVDCLSGGMKRKLSVAIAFVAGSRTVILDEPTAGVDPYARRQIWDLLMKYKPGRTILLSTHHMDEADILGDRIAIISNGQLKCCGSSLYLKNMYGDGYHLVIVKKASDDDIQSIDTLSQEDPLNSSHSSFTTKCSGRKVTRFITSHVRTAYTVWETAQELHYILPFEEAKKGNFEKLFQALDGALEQLDISSYGVIDTDLEEVFLKVTDKAINEQETESEEEDTKTEKEEEARLLHDQLQASAPSPSPDGARGDGRRESVETLSTTSIHSDSLLLAEHANDVELGNMAASGVLRFRDAHVDDDLMSSDSDTTHNINNSGNKYTKLPVQDEPSILLEGKGSYEMHGHWLLLQQFIAILIKRFHYTTRNWKGLFSQIILPALFICVAMTVALTAPRLQDEPPLVLSPAQYYNYTQPTGNYIPYLNQAPGYIKPVWNQDATPEDIVQTFRLPSGVGATCCLKTPYNSSFDAAILKQLNFTYRNFNLLEKYFEPQCESVFVKGISLQQYMPPPPTAAPQDASKDKNMSEIVTERPVDKNRYYPNCHCAPENNGFICDKAYVEAPHFQAVTSDIVQDVSGDKEEDYFLDTTDMYRLNRYGGFSLGNIRPYIPEDFGKNAPSEFRRLAVRHVAKVRYNHKGYHAMPTYLNTLNNAILRANLPKSKGNPAAYGITLINHPINNTNHIKNMDFIMQGSDVLIAIFIIVAMSFVPASFVLFLVYEKSIKAKHLQFVSGIYRVVYWVANYIWDMCNYVIPAVCCIIILKGFDIPAYVSAVNFPAVIALFLMYGWSITPMMYPVSFVFNEPSTAYIVLIVANLFIGITCIVTSFLLELFSRNDEDLAQVHNILKSLFLTFPNYCLGRGLMDIAFNEYHNQYYLKTGQFSKMRSPFEWELVSRNLVAMAAMGLGFFIITLLCEFRFFIKPRRLPLNPYMAPPDEDQDVANERKRVLRGSGRRDLLRLENLTKIYQTRKQGRHLAVDRLCLGVPQGECFGLLGVNGAGKTTTFKMLTGDFPPTGGDAHLNGNSVRKELAKVQRNIGYCPQFDALYDELTAREHLYLYARLRGVPPKDQKQVVEWALEKLCLKQYADKQSVTYSGGNKRKLSTAIALIGHPPLIFMDEPTTGMDPHSRRFLWDLIISLVKGGRSVVLTSHSMEECEALCTRLAIMVNGRFKCIGSTQHLKSRFGEGYTVTLRVKGPNYERNALSVTRFMQRQYPNATLKESHHSIVQFELSSGSFSLSQLFGRMEEAQRDLPVEDYSVSQNTLDNVFLNFVKNQNEINRASTDGTDASHQGAAASNHSITSLSAANGKRTGGTTNNTELIAIGGSNGAAENGEDLDDLPIQLKPTERVRADPYDDDPIWEHSALNSKVTGAGSGRAHCEGGAPSYPI